MTRLRLAAAAVAGAAVLVPAAPALAGNGAVHPDSVTWHDAIMSFAAFVPCNHDLGGVWVTATVNGQQHSTANNNGFWVTSTQAGPFVATPIELVLDDNGQPVLDSNRDPVPVLDNAGNPIPRAGETFTGREQNWFGASINPNESVVTGTDNVQGTGSNGTTFDAHENQHIVTLGGGDPFDPTTPLKLMFDHATCH